MGSVRRADNARAARIAEWDEAHPDHIEESQLSIGLLGGFRVSIGERRISDSEWYLRKAKNLLKLLALAPNHRLPREQVMDLLWPELDPEAATNNLHKALHIARRVLEPDLPPKVPSSYLHLHGVFVTLDPPSELIVDTERFEARAHAAQASGDLSLYKEALDLYAGELLPEDRYDDWAVGPREKLKGLHTALLLEVADLYMQHENPADAISALREVVVADPTHEEATVQLMRLLALSGHRHLALQQYRLLEDGLRRELDVEPDPEVQAVYRQILDDYRLSRSHMTSRPVPPAQPQTPGRSLLLSRDRDLATIQRLLLDLGSGHGGRIFLAGESGIGKTRLALEAAHMATDSGAAVLWAEPTEERPIDAALLDACSRRAASRNGSIPSTVGRSTGGPVLDRPIVPELIALLSGLSEESPLVVVLDGLHTMDESSARGLASVVQGLTGRPILFLGTFQPAGGAYLRPLLSIQPAITLTLRGLAHASVAELAAHLLGSPLSPDAIDVVVSLSEGNPYYIEEAVRALAGRGYIEERNGVWQLRDGASRLTRSSLRHRDRPGFPLHVRPAR